MLSSILLALHVLLSISLIVLILLQQGKGADAGAAFGSGASATVFGSRGSATFLSKATGILAALFLVVSLVLAYLASGRDRDTSVVDRLPIDGIEQSVPSDIPGVSGEALPQEPVGESESPLDIPR